jgi:Cu2+-exporting ATPase
MIRRNRCRMILMRSTELLCFHCGDQVPDDCKLTVDFNQLRHPVCCSGCLAVFTLIADSGLDRYYKFRQSLGLKASENLQSKRQAWLGVDGRKSLWGVSTRSGQRELLLQVEGIRCAACAWLIRSQLERFSGISSVQVDTATGYTHIVWDPDQIKLSTIAMTLFELGYVPHLPIASEEERGRRQEQRESLKRLGVAGLGMMQVMMYAVGLYAGESQGMSPAARGFLTWVSLLVTLPVLLYSGRVFFTGAWRSIVAGRPGMDVPVSIAIALAFTASCSNFFRGSGEVWFDSVVMFIFFLSLGRYVELVLRHKNLQAGTALARLMPEWAVRITAAETETIPSFDVTDGDTLRVPPGEAFPADGVIVSGITDVDESLLTGESRARPRQNGDRVIAGTLNLSQSVDMKVTAAGNESTISALGRLVLAAQTRRDSDHSLPGWLIPGFVSAVLILATLTWLYWYQVQPAMAFPSALAVLVASCPCALSLALPAVYSAASHKLLAQGILLTRGNALNDLTRVDSVLFDKTGTLTLGRPELVQTLLNPERSGFNKSEVLGLCAALEAHSSHPVARAFRPFPYQQPATSVTHHQSGGLEGVIDGRNWRLGSERFINTVGADGSDRDGSSDIILADGNGWIARFTLNDTLRPDCERTLEYLSDQGFDMRVVSGDGKEAVEALADQLAIKSWFAGQTPQQKLDMIHCMQQQGRVVLMVGDGANDGPVLAAADVSMTVQGATELANSTADMILTSESLGLLETAIETSQRAARLVRQNLTWALIYNASVLPLAMSGTLKPWMAALGMSASSLLVVLNAARLSMKQDRSMDSNSLAAMRVQTQ